MKTRSRRLVVRGPTAPAEKTAVGDNGRGDRGVEGRRRGCDDVGGGGGGCQGRRRAAMPPLPSPLVSTPRNRRIRVCLLLSALVVMHGIYTVLPKTSTNDVYGDLPSRLPYGEVDDLGMGKICVYNKRHVARGKKSWWSNSHRRRRDDDPWTCRECTPEGGCYPLRRRGRCRPFERYLDSGSKDEVPRSYLSFSPYTSRRSAISVYHHDGHAEYSQEYPICGASLSPPCFDLGMCARMSSSSQDDDGGGPLLVYSHGGVVDEYLDYASASHPTMVRRVRNASDACLLVVGRDSYMTPNDLFDNPHWDNGRNHFVFESDRLYGTHHDRPFNDKVSFGLAAVSNTNMDDAYIREGYDMAYSYYPAWKRPDNYDSLDVHRPRKYLISFKGNIYPWETRSWQHRWIAAEYWSDDPDVHVDTKCEDASGATLDYENADPDDYGRTLLDSTFYFCPGGGGVMSYRFAESLLAGSIPVVTSDFLPPFHPELDWSGCVVRVSDARVVDIPRILREISTDEVRERRLRCADLTHLVYGNPSGNVTSYIAKRMFSVGMGIWYVRIKSALKRRDEVENMIKLKF